MRKRVETTISDIKKMFPRTIHAVTLNGFLIKLILFVFGLQINKITNKILELFTKKFTKKKKNPSKIIDFRRVF